MALLALCVQLILTVRIEAEEQASNSERVLQQRCTRKKNVLHHIKVGSGLFFIARRTIAKR